MIFDKEVLKKRLPRHKILRPNGTEISIVHQSIEQKYITAIGLNSQAQEHLIRK